MRACGAFLMVKYIAVTAIAFAASAGPVLAADLAALLSDKASLSSELLAGQRGGAAPTATATVSDSTAFTGINNSVNEVANSMNGAQGLFNVIQNNGNNVAIQSQIVVNANLH